MSWTIHSLSNSLPWESVFSMSPYSSMIVNLTIASADVCRVNKRGNKFVYLILIAPLYIETLHSFGNNCFTPSPDLCTLLNLFNIDVPIPSDFLLAMFELIVNCLSYSISTSCLLESNYGSIDLPCYSYAYSPPSWCLASLFLFEIWKSVEWSYFWCGLQIRIKYL